jgi:hypothetical protein
MSEREAGQENAERAAGGEGVSSRMPRVPLNPEDKGAASFPWNSVVGVIDDAAHVETAVAALIASGYSEAGIKVLAGEAGEFRIDAEGKRHGLLGRIFRKIQALGDEDAHTQRHVGELQAGHFVIVVQNADDKSPERAGEILKSNGGRFIYHYTRMTSSELAP